MKSEAENPAGLEHSYCHGLRRLGREALAVPPWGPTCGPRRGGRAETLPQLTTDEIARLVDEHIRERALYAPLPADDVIALCAQTPNTPRPAFKPKGLARSVRPRRRIAGASWTVGALCLLLAGLLAVSWWR